MSPSFAAVFIFLVVSATTINAIPQNGLKSRCGRHAYYSPCASRCPAICNDPNPMMCAADCVLGCRCDPGYIRQFNSRDCISESDCNAQKD